MSQNYLNIEELFENINPISQNIYSNLNDIDISNLLKTSKSLNNFIKSYIGINNRNKFKNEVIYIFLRSLYYFIFSYNFTKTNNKIIIKSDIDKLIMEDADPRGGYSIDVISGEYQTENENQYNIVTNFTIETNTYVHNPNIINKISIDMPNSLIFFIEYMIHFPFDKNKNYSINMMKTANIYDNELIEIYNNEKNIFDPNKLTIIKFFKLLINNLYTPNDSLTFEIATYNNYYLNTKGNDFLNYINLYY